MNEACCPMCGGPGMELGALGVRVHFRCRDCAVDFSHVDENAKREEKNKKARERRRAMRDAADSVGVRMVRGAHGGRYYE